MSALTAVLVLPGTVGADHGAADHGTRDHHRHGTGTAGRNHDGAGAASADRTGPAGGTGTETGTETETPWYLAIGASESVGVQPTPAHPHGTPTDQGYADVLTQRLADRWPGLRSARFGCPGDSSASTLTGDDRCYRGVGSQMERDVEFLATHRGDVRLVTIDLGFNDVAPCVRHGERVARACVTAGLAGLAPNLTTVVDRVRSAAGPHVLIVGLNHEDPFLALPRLGSGRDRDSTLGAIERLNRVLGTVYRREHVPVADVFDAFRARDGGAVVVHGLSQPRNVATVCADTWMCAAPPLGPNLHPDAAGYRVIADAIGAVVARSS